MPDEGISAANSRPRPVRDSILAAVRFFKILLHRQRPRPRCARDLLVSFSGYAETARARPTRAGPAWPQTRAKHVADRGPCRGPRAVARVAGGAPVPARRPPAPQPATPAPGNAAACDGSAASPFRSSRRALDPAHGVVSAGDVVEIDGHPGQGRYDECDVRLRVRLTLRSAPGGRAHIRCDPDTPDSVTVQIDP